MSVRKTFHRASYQASETTWLEIADVFEDGGDKRMANTIRNVVYKRRKEHERDERAAELNAWYAPRRRFDPDCIGIAFRNGSIAKMDKFVDSGVL